MGAKVIYTCDNCGREGSSPKGWMRLAVPHTHGLVVRRRLRERTIIACPSAACRKALLGRVKPTKPAWTKLRTYFSF